MPDDTPEGMPDITPRLRQRMHDSDLRETRGNIGCVGTVVTGTILVWQALIIADASGIRPSSEHHFRANAMLEWTLPIAILLWLASFLPRLPTRARRALVWTAMTLLVGTGVAWFV